MPFSDSVDAALSLVENHSGFLVLDHLAPERWLVHELDLLKHFIAVLRHFLVLHATRINVIFHKLLCSSELHMLIHQLGHKISVIHELHHVLLHDCVLVGGFLEARQGALSLPHQSFVVLVDVIHAVTDRHLFEKRVGLTIRLVGGLPILPRLLWVGQTLGNVGDVQLTVITKLFLSLWPIRASIRWLVAHAKWRPIGPATFAGNVSIV